MQTITKLLGFMIFITICGLAKLANDYVQIGHGLHPLAGVIAGCTLLTIYHAILDCFAPTREPIALTWPILVPESIVIDLTQSNTDIEFDIEDFFAKWERVS